MTPYRKLIVPYDDDDDDDECMTRRRMPLCLMRNGIMRLLHLSICGYLFFKLFTADFFVLFRPTTLHYINVGFLKAILQVTCELVYYNCGPMIYPVHSLFCL